MGRRFPLRSVGARGAAAAAALTMLASLSGPASAGGGRPTANRHAETSTAAAHHHQGHHRKHHHKHHHKPKGQKVNGSFFGMWAPMLTAAYPDAPLGALDLSANGVYWPAIETLPGHYNFTNLDALVAQAQANNAKPLLVLGDTPRFYADLTDPAPAYTQMPPLDAWDNFVQAVVQRYGDQLDYEIWPEPDITSNWSGTPQQLATLVASASRIIHATAPKAVVVSPAMVLRLPFELRWMKSFYAQKVDGHPIGSYVDVVGVDPYPLVDGTPESSAAYYTTVRAILKKNKVSAPLWNMEINYGVLGAHQTVTPLSMQTQASYVVRTYLLNAAADVKRVYWLIWRYQPTLGVQMLDIDNSTVTEAGVAYRTVHGWLQGSTVGPCTVDKKHHLYTCAVSRKGDPGRVYWTTKGKAKLRVPKGARHLETMTGATRKVHAGHKVVITGAPVYLHH